MEKLVFGLTLLNVDNIWRIYSKDEITEHYANLAKIVSCMWREYLRQRLLITLPLC